MQATQFWDDLFSKGQQGEYSRVEMPDLEDPVLQKALAYFGDVKGKTIIDLGCGRGATSLYFAHKGANVISIDSSEVAVRNLTEYCQSNAIGNINPLTLRAQELASIGSVDFVFGSMILHHIEPFNEFARTLRDVIKLGGKGFFMKTMHEARCLYGLGKILLGGYGYPNTGIRMSFHSP